MTVRKSQELKGLKTRLSEAEVDLSMAKETTREAQRKESDAFKRVNGLRQQIAEIEADSKDVIVTEHAILRYIERVYGIDLEEIRNEMVGDAERALIDQFRTGKIPCKGGRLVVKDRTVVTVEAA